jgi:radical SAM protein with 4Fe4S-binding SPASM domain
MSNFVTLPHLTPKEKAFFAPANHERVTQLIKAGNCINCLKDIPPIYLNLDITWRCNYDCVGCIDGGVVGRDEIVKETNLDMDWAVAKDLLEYGKRFHLLGFIVQGGEPLLYPQIDKLLDFCGENGFVLRLVTNGSQLINHTDALIHAFRVPKSIIRVSINADESHYKDFTQGKIDLGTVVKGIDAVSSGGGSICVGTVVFGRNIKFRRIPHNVFQLKQILDIVGKAGARWLVLLPGRDPITKEMIPFDKDELDLLDEISNSTGPTKVILGGRFAVEKELPACDQIKNYAPCPTALLRIVVGSDGRLFNCTEHRGMPEAEIGRISKAAMFESVWHAEQRVRRQIQFDPRVHCEKITCDRHGINTTVETARRGYAQFGCPSIVRHVLLDHEDPVETFF